jgi:hypothetical protein
MLALIAVANKLLKQSFRIVMYELVYDPDNVRIKVTSI